MRKADVFEASTSLGGIGPSRLRRPRILVVDDDEDLRAAVRDILQDDGLVVLEAPNGSAAIDCLLATPILPGLILLDLNMPIMSGREMIPALRGHLRFSTIPVLLTTSEVLHPTSSIEGTVGRLQKPFSVRELLAAVRQHVAPAPDP